jgi:hypothetical protein
MLDCENCKNVACEQNQLRKLQCEFVQDDKEEENNLFKKIDDGSITFETQNGYSCIECFNVDKNLYKTTSTYRYFTYDKETKTINWLSREN